MTNVLNELSENNIILLLVQSNDYNKIILNTIKDLSEETVCYVTLNKTSEALKEVFEKNKVKTENIIFIDAITKTFSSAPSQKEGCYYISSPSALTELLIAVTKVLNHGFKYLVFDSITNLLIYQKKAPIAKFISNIINTVRANNTKAVFYTLKIKEQQTIIEETKMFVDKTIDLSEW